jgi:hypothetical protein
VIVKRHLESQEQVKNAHQENQNQEALTDNNHREHGRNVQCSFFCSCFGQGIYYAGVYWEQ